MRKNKSAAEQGNIRPLGFLVWKETLHYLNLVTKITIMYFDRYSVMDLSYKGAALC